MMGTYEVVRTREALVALGHEVDDELRRLAGLRPVDEFLWD